MLAELFFIGSIVPSWAKVPEGRSAGNIVGSQHLRTKPLMASDGGVGQFRRELHQTPFAKDGASRALEQYPPALRGYLTQVTEIVATSGQGNALQRIRRLFTRSDPKALLAALKEMHRVPEYTPGTMYSRLPAPLYHDPERRFVELVAMWRPGQKTHIHNRLTATGQKEQGVIGVLQGEVRVTHFRKEGNRLVQVGQFELRAGQAAIVREIEGQHHQVENIGDVDLLMLDHYEPELRKTEVFPELEERLEPFRGRIRRELVVEPIRIPAGQQNLLLPDLLIAANVTGPRIDEILARTTIEATKEALVEAKRRLLARNGSDKRPAAAEGPSGETLARQMFQEALKSRDPLRRAAEVAHSFGYDVTIDPEPFSGHVEDVADRIFAAIKKNSQNEKPRVLLWGGKTILEPSAKAKNGGPNSHLALEVARWFFLLGLKKVTFLAASPSGRDGDWNGAGAIVTGRTYEEAERSGLDITDHLERYDSATFLEKLAERTGGERDLRIVTGPTGAKAMDIAIAVIPPRSSKPKSGRDGGNREQIRPILPLIFGRTLLWAVMQRNFCTCIRTMPNIWKVKMKFIRQ